MPVNKRYFTDLMKDRSLSMREVARRMDTWPAGLSRALDGKRKLPLEEAAGLARVLGVPLAEVMLNAGIEEAKAVGRRCHIIGHLREGGVVDSLPPGTIERIPIPDLLEDDVVAVQAHTADTGWSYCDGWVTFLTPARDPAELINMLALCALEDGGSVMAVIRRGYTSGMYNLFNAKGNVNTNVRITSARRALITLY